MLDVDSNESSLMQARMRVEQTQFSKQVSERKSRKNPEQIKILLENFNKKPIWDYPTKIAIAE